MTGQATMTMEPKTRTVVRFLVLMAGTLLAALAMAAIRPSTALADVWESESNDSFETADTVPFSEYVHGTCETGDRNAQDYFRVYIPIDGDVDFWSQNESNGYGKTVTLYDPNRNYIVSVGTYSYETAPHNFKTRVTRGTYYIRVSGYENGDPYRIWVTLPYLDATPSTPHYVDILHITQKSITTGFEHVSSMSAGYKDFRPYSPVVRCDMAAFLFRMAQNWNVGGASSSWQPSAADKARFTDVTDSTPHAREIRWLASKGISTGWGREFRPYAKVARQDMAAFLFRLAKLAGRGGASDSWSASSSSRNRFCDVDANAADNHHREIWWLAQKGISTGWDAGNGKWRFKGRDSIARCDMAAFIHRVNLL